LEVEFLTKGIPYRVDGQEPFYKRKEINTLLDYIRVAKDYNLPITENIAGLVLSVANKPSRMLSRTLLNQVVFYARQRQLPIRTLLQTMPRDYSAGINGWQADRIGSLAFFLDILQSQMQSKEKNAGNLLTFVFQPMNGKYL
jgi:DNA helicase II / ATP-dependent DNA helicase PcrA